MMQMNALKLLAPGLAVASLNAMAQPTSASEEDARAIERAIEAESCAAVQDDLERLVCYNKLVPVETGASSSGRPRCEQPLVGDDLRRCRLTLGRRMLDCTVHADHASRGSCFDSIARKSPADPERLNRPHPGWRLRDEIAINGIGQLTAGKNGAKLTYSEDAGNDTLKGAVAALYVWRNSESDWQPFGGVGWKGDHSTATKSESLSLALGAQSSMEAGTWTVQPTVLLSHRQARFGGNDITQLTANNDVLIPGWSGLTRFGLSYELVPLAGVNVANVSSDVGESGLTAGAYAGLRFALQLKKLFPRTVVEGFGQWYGDMSPLPGTRRRYVRFWTTKLVHNLADPAKTTGWIPAIVLNVANGTEPVRGDTGLDKVSFELSVRFD